MSAKLTEEEKNQIFDLLADSYLYYLEYHDLGRFERKHLARKILDNVGKAQSIDEVCQFIDQFAKKYTFFSNAAVKVKAMIKSEQEQQVINKLRSFITNYQSA